MNRIIATLLIAATAAQGQGITITGGVPARNTDPRLTNTQVIQMWTAGLSPNTIIRTIEQRPANFDTSPEALIELKQKGVPDSVIEAMLAHSNQSLAGTKLDQQAQPPPQPHPNPANTNLLDVQSLADGFYFKTDHGWQMLEPLSMAGGGASHVGKVLVPGLTPHIVWTFHGAESPAQMSNKRPVFCVKEPPAFANIAGRARRDLLIVRFDKKNDRRELQVTNGGNVFTFKSGMSKDRMPDITTESVADGIFMVTPSEDLKPGEYMLTFSSMGISGYDFGIRQ